MKRWILTLSLRESMCEHRCLLVGLVVILVSSFRAFVVLLVEYMIFVKLLVSDYDWLAQT